MRIRTCPTGLDDEAVKAQAHEQGPAHDHANHLASGHHHSHEVDFSRLNVSFVMDVCMYVWPSIDYNFYTHRPR